MTFEEIARANAGIRTLNIKGKNYAPVTERIKAFRTVCPNGSIETELLEDADGRCVFKATVRDGETVLGVGHAFEKEESSFINRTSYVENCETSSVGRALGMAGFGTDESLASYEELANALKNQEKEKPKTSGPICSECGREILPATNANGKMWTAEKIAQTTTEKYGRALCCGCARALHPSER